jgi:hypothetical protein
MTPSDRSPGRAAPRIIPMRPHPRPEQAEPTLRGALARAAADVARSVHGLPTVTISLDVPDAHTADAAPEAVAAPLRRLLEAACMAMAAPASRGACPAVREVLVTTVDTGAALEIEVADSAADVSRQEAAVAEIRPLVEQAGWTLSSAACPDGGLAVTLRIPRRRGRSRVAA